MIYYLLVTGSLSFVLIHGVGLNMGTVVLVLTLVGLATLLLWLRHRDADEPLTSTERDSGGLR